MRAGLFDWVWRAAVLTALVWIGLQLQLIHADLNLPADAQGAVAASGDAPDDQLEELGDKVDRLTEKVNAILVVMARSS